MGQSLDKIEKHEEKKIKLIGPAVESCYGELEKHSDRDQTFDNFYQALCETVEKINEKLGSTQFRITKTDRLRDAYEKHHKEEEKPLTLQEFEEILREVIEETGIRGTGAKDTLIYTFGVPIAAFFIKQRLIPRAIPNVFFIPGITSLTVFLLSKFNKI
ncbi:uncharacterized protein LOC107435879 isoform X2 [Ziziphus jujuba]|uniref:Uncharacterized protein LOC107435879 isoform X2 n=1 Tax=Ziziphus jujuba TaxID=326968 RepID=A0ABM3I6X9_ZIZJJ|nr:uncharacterized protein LOC107435879 isoform X2 [Ziziphus jujuba]